MTINNRQDYVILDLIQQAVRNVKAQPVNLGGVSGTGGGEGMPPGGFIGLLAQTKVAYDTDEAAYSGILSAPSGTLVDNLAHIRYRLQSLESVSGLLIVSDDNNSITYSNIDTIHFSGAGVVVTDLGAGDIRVSIDATGSGGTALTVEEYDGTPSVTSVDKIIFSGATVTDLGSGDVLITFSGITASGIEEAPIDGNIYGRMNGNWSVITSSGTPLTVMDYDSSPKVTNVDTIIFSGAQIVDLGSGDVLVTFSGTTSEQPIHVYNELPSGIPGRVFNTLYTYASGTLRVYYNGIRQVKGIHYLDDVELTTFSTYFDTYSGDYIVVDYDYYQSLQTGNAWLVDSDGVLITDSDGVQLV